MENEAPAIPMEPPFSISMPKRNVATTSFPFTTRDHFNKKLTMHIEVIHGVKIYKLKMERRADVP